ncbi:MAG: CopD family protein [Anaerolineae bacterium]
MSLLILGGIRPALAHGYIIRSIPEDRAILQYSPTRLQYWFSEALEARFTSLEVRDQNGTTVATGGVDRDNNALLSARLPRNLPDSVYIVDMRVAFSSDGHVIAQTRTFVVGQAVGDVAAGELNSQVNGLEVIWRVLVISSTMLLFGTFVIYQAILIPAWGNTAYHAGLLPSRVMRRLSLIILIALIISFIGNVVAILQQTMSFFDTGLEQVISQNLWSVTRVGTRFGDLWNGRMLLLGLVSLLFALSRRWNEEHPKTVRPFWIANVWVMALVIGTLSAGSHATGSLTLIWVAIFNDWLHALAVGAWVGGLGALVLIIPTALAPYKDDERRLALLAVLRRYSRLAAACLVIVIATGLYSAVNWIYSPPDITNTDFGRALLLKLLLVGGLVFMGTMHHMAVRPERYQRWQQLTKRFSRFCSSLRLEALLALGTLAAVGLLSATPVPIPYFIQDSIPAPSATQTLDNLSVNLTITPGGTGTNTYDLAIARGGLSLNDATIRLQMVNPERDQRSKWVEVENASEGLYVGVGDEINRTGKWWTLVDVTSVEGSIKRFAFVWDVTDTATIQSSQPPRIQHIVGLMMVLAALGYVVYPSAKRIYRRLDLNPVNVTILIATLVATILLSAVGFIVIQNAQNQFESTLNPLPQIVNSVLPDEASLIIGQKLYQQYCTDWQNINLNGFIERLPRTRDEQIFATTRDGGADVPACNKILSEMQRWDLVNYIRTFER